MDQASKERLSPALLSAQRKLLSLRKQFRVAYQHQDPDADSHGRLNLTQIQLSQSSHSSYGLPKHFSWGSAPLTRALRISEANEAKRITLAEVGSLSWINPTRPSTGGKPSPEKQQPADRHTIKLYPDLALAMLKQRQVTTGRIWLILRALDGKGRGWFDLTDVTDQLAGKTSAFRICGRRQLRKLVNRGEGLFWNKRNGRLWLRSPAKVAAALSLPRLTGRPVALPVRVLLQSIGSIRAHFYASFHSGRLPSSDKARPKPVSRATLVKLSGISRRTQRRYENQLGIRCQHNYVIAGRYSTEHHREQTWQRGRAVFIFKDLYGKLGQPGIRYTAWQLPNSYTGPHECLSKGHQKRLNREIADLFMKGITGNDDFSEPITCSTSTNDRRCFFENGTSAGVSYNRTPHQDAYWRSQHRCTGDDHLWHLFPAQVYKRG